MSQVTPQLVSAALVGTFSPIATMATIAVLTGRRRPLVNAICLLAGWTFVLTALAEMMLALLGEAGSAPSDQTKAVLNVIIGILLVSFGLRNVIGARHPMAHVVEARTEHRQKPPGWMALDVLSPAKAVGVGAVLLLVSPADLAVYLSALQGLSGNEFAPAGRLLTLIGLIAAIDLCILVPLAIYVVMPRRAAHLLGGMRRWLTTHQRRAAAWVLLVFGLLLTLSGALHLA